MNTNSYYGKNNSNWKGNKITDRAKHYRLVAKRGKASDHKCARCHKTQAMDWAEMKNGEYKPLCRSCHNIYDSKVKNIWDHDPRYKDLKEELLKIAKRVD